MQKLNSRLLPLTLIIALLFASFAASAELPQTDDVIHSDDIVISIIIDDLGNHLASGTRAVELPGALTYAFLPYLPYSPRLAELANTQHKEVMLHLPMEADSGKSLGPGGLTQVMNEHEFKNELRKSINAVPHIRGFNNHMGSLLTKNSEQMKWIMQAAMFRDDLYFVDSRTTPKTVALQEAQKRGIRGAKRDIFLDYEKDKEDIVRQQLDALIARAKKKGTALAIGHPYKGTLKVLEAWLPTLKKQGIKLVPVSDLISIRKTRSHQRWQLSSFH
ncbi:Putative periplasmic protein YibQ, distant homology with nucleoside diphosphatase and polysaccharide deacetylase [hydrothermal vent metagenome]|uniref:Periplasmic protein YibQ, distant homology with nucleoside diphosphatase and polysaccharide deacetylase n=1 Tax=hydrothermal vent metagenome TaxID=652676 RepID=A0A3B1BUH9_9ZZZZ